jgi:hypothetical protein
MFLQRHWLKIDYSLGFDKRRGVQTSPKESIIGMTEGFPFELVLANMSDRD